MERGVPDRARLVRRRTALTAGLAGLAATGLGLSSDTTFGMATPEPLANQSNVLVESVHSQARNREVDLVTMYPKGVRREGLPVCLVLHGRFGDARNSAAGLPSWLSASVARGKVPPFALLAVDGGSNSYWHHREGDDPMWMLLDEIPRWLSERRLGGPHGQPFAVIGTSMGGFGGLVYTRQRNWHESPLDATAVISPALVTHWDIMRKRRAFASEAEWAAIDPLRHVHTLGAVPLGVWCGTRDRFIKGTRRFIQLADPEIASTTPGGHNSRYYRKALPEAINFVGRKLRQSSDRS